MSRQDFQRAGPDLIELTVPNEHAGMRLDRYLALVVPQFSRSRLQALIRHGLVQVEGNSVRPRDIVRAGEVVRLSAPPPETIEARPENIPLEVIFEDDDLIVINKPAGLVVHPGAGNREHTLVNALLHHCAQLSGIGGKQRPGIVHRLDKETSGAMVVAKNDAAHQELSRQFAAREVRKIYLALVAGSLGREHGTLVGAIARHPAHRTKMAVTQTRGRSARTDYRVLRSSGAISLVECSLHSGRTHQVRVHFYHLGHPILGDQLYGGKKGAAPRQMLHAWKLGFVHPRTRERMLFEARLPEDFRAAMQTAGLSD